MKRMVFSVFCIMIFGVLPAFSWTPLAVTDDPLVRMPGTQPGQVVDLESDKQCLSCHAGGQYEMENWKGSLMAQASRDPIFWAGLTVAAQDAIYVLGNPNAADICVKCHFPQGWLDGRSDPVNASLMRGEDYDGVSCKTCHYMYDPFYQTTYDGTREGGDWTNYWDEVGDLSGAVDATRNADAEAASAITYFNGNSFFSNNAPASAGYTENGGGHIYLVTHTAGISDGKRAPFADANAKHDFVYSRYHKSKYLCGTCHDISNPALANLGHTNTVPGDGTTILPSESQPAYSYAHVERTFSEFMLSGYGVNGGMTGTGPYSPDQFKTSHAGNKIATCQDCHFRDIEGVAAAKGGVIRPEESDPEPHPLSGVPEHRMIGGNLWVSYLLASIVPGSPNYDATNESLLKQGPAALTLDFSQGEALDPLILLETIDQSAQMLQDSISMANASYALSNNVFTLRLQNHTGHKLISGYPEGRRMFLNIRAYAGNDLIYEINPYDDSIGTLKGLENSQSSPALSTAEEYVDELVYEVHQSSSVLGVNETFHMALATERYKDNRILPRGFRVADAAERLCEPVWHGHSDTNYHAVSNYYTQAEYEGGYDEVTITFPAGTERVEAGLYYQTTSREFIEFLRDEINGVNGTLPNVIGAGGQLPYIAQTDDWFSGMKAWGNTIWNLWDHNKNIPGAAPVLMTNTLVQLDVSDTDADGIPAYWETENFGGATNANPALDSDLDGKTDYDEYISMTDPNDGDSLFFTDFSPASYGADIGFLARYARNYELLFTTNLVLGGWAELFSGAGADELMLFTHTNQVPQGFYRVNVELP